MQLEWRIGNNIYQQDLDMMQLLYHNGIPFDSDLWIGLNLLDVEAFRQYKKSMVMESNNEKEYYLELIDQYNKIDNIIIDAFVDSALINDMYMVESNGFEKDFAKLVDILTPYLHSRRPLPMDYIDIPISEREDINDLLNTIRFAISGRIEHIYNNQTQNYKSRRNQFTMQKDIIRKAIIKIAEKYSEESKIRYDVFYGLCKKYNISNLYSYDCAKVAICANTILEYITPIEENIGAKVRTAFENRLSIEDFKLGLSSEKINQIKKFFDERDFLKKGMTHYNAMRGKLRRYFEKSRRCVAIMELPDRDSDNMFSLSGIELKDDKEYNDSFETNVANPIARELNLIGRYMFCKQNIFMRRYAHKINGIYKRLNQWNYLDDDCNWKANQMDYACCERKLIAELEMKKIFPRNIVLWTRFTICDNCQYAINDYQDNYGAVIQLISV